MSPEQARGKPVDHRSDQFALGTLLYEMATGRKAFRRETRAETLTAIMRDEPEPISTTNPAFPPPARWIVDRCLAKDPGGRFASTLDLAHDLRSLREHLSEVGSSPPFLSWSGASLFARRPRRGRCSLSPGRWWHWRRRSPCRRPVRASPDGLKPGRLSPPRGAWRCFPRGGEPRPGRPVPGRWAGGDPEHPAEPARTASPGALCRAAGRRAPVRRLHAGGGTSDTRSHPCRDGPRPSHRRPSPARRTARGRRPRPPPALRPELRPRLGGLPG